MTDRADATSADDLVGRLVITGSGEPLGHVTRIDRSPDGEPRGIVVAELAVGHEWHVGFEHVRRIGLRVHLKGPREGFHIAPMGRGGEERVEEKTHS